MPTVLIIDDNAAVGIALDVLFSLHDIAALRAASPEEGLAILAREPVDLVIQDRKGLPSSRASPSISSSRT